MTKTTNQIEILRARDYYGGHATGVVVLVNGNPTHFTGGAARKDAESFIATVSSTRNKP